MKRLVLLVVAGALLAPPIAGARDGRPAFNVQAQDKGRQMKKSAPPFKRGERDRRGERDKRQQNRLTDEERRGLQRDLERANREIYRR